MTSLYSKITDALVDDGYIIITDALSDQLSTSLKELAKQESNFTKAGISSSSNLHIDTNKRRDKIKWLNEDSSAQSEFLAFSNGLKEYLNKELYLGLSYYEAHLAIYKEGDFYEKHLDSFKNSKNRVVTTVYYLNDEWSKDDGGELVIYDENSNILTKVSPSSNTLVVFLSEKFPHEVLPAKSKRYSIAGWFRVDK
ncbi:MAG: 2OG-Fe(II) oxygenase [Helicobacteraceae bacterium]|nr:2OG-Fe(II) oxygenase [Helicobacteraceae bacterium]